MLHWPKSNPLASATGTVSTIGPIRHTLDQLFFKKKMLMTFTWHYMQNVLIYLVINQVVLVHFCTNS